MVQDNNFFVGRRIVIGLNSVKLGFLARITLLGTVFLLSACSSLSNNSQDKNSIDAGVDAGAKDGTLSAEQVSPLPNTADPIPQGIIEGQVSYRERIALLPGVFVRIVLERQGNQSEPPLEVAEQIFHPSGQVPFEYQLKFNTEDIRGGFRYVVKGQIFSEDERLLFASEEGTLLEPLGAKRYIDLLLKRVALTHQTHMASVTAAVSRVYQCGDFAFGTRTGIGEIALYLPSGVTVLSQVTSASGARYKEGDILFWVKGEQAMLAYDGAFYRNCQRRSEREARDPVERRPVDFRAIGNEPPWLLEVVEGHNINLITEYGQKRLQLEEPEKTVTPEQITYHVNDDANRLAVMVKREACSDTMSDKVWPNSVSIWWNSRHYNGCGTFLAEPKGLNN